MYRSPNSTKDNNTQLNVLVQSLSQKNEPFILVGDFNYPNINWSSSIINHESSNNSSRLFLDTLNENFLLQHVLQPTRCRGTQSSNVLDLVITNDDFISSIDYLSPLGKSDHCNLYITCNLSVLPNLSNTTKLNYNKGDYNSISNFLYI